MNNQVIVTGGQYRHGVSVDLCYKIDIHTGKVELMANMTHQRSLHCMAQSKNKVYVISGSTDHNRLTSHCEVFGL